MNGANERFETLAKWSIAVSSGGAAPAQFTRRWLLFRTFAAKFGASANITYQGVTKLISQNVIT